MVEIAVIEGTQGGSVLPELLAQDVDVGGLAGEPIPMLGEDCVDATGKDGVAQGIESESIQRGPGCRILELPHHLKVVGVTIAS